MFANPPNNVMEIRRDVNATVMYRRGQLHLESDFPNEYSLNPPPDRNTGNGLNRITPPNPNENPCARPAPIAFGFPSLRSEKHGLP